MTRRLFLLIILFMGLLLCSCQAQNPPDPPMTVIPSEIGFTQTVAPLMARGEFVLTNTSFPGIEVGIETMDIILEYRLFADGAWEKVLTDCTFKPPAPVVLKDPLLVRYECTCLKQLPPNAELHTTAEVRIFGSDLVYRLEVASP